MILFIHKFLLYPTPLFAVSGLFFSFHKKTPLPPYPIAIQKHNPQPITPFLTDAYAKWGEEISLKKSQYIINQHYMW